MKKLRVCVGTNDSANIANTHMGDTSVFMIYDISEDKPAEFLETRKNTASDMEHAQKNKMKEILTILDDVDVLAASKLSPNFKNIAKNTKHQPVIVNATNIQQVLTDITKSFRSVNDLVSRRKTGARFSDIPVI